jgi:hypothetical protein
VRLSLRDNDNILCCWYHLTTQSPWNFNVIKSWQWWNRIHYNEIPLQWNKLQISEWQVQIWGEETHLPCLVCKKGQNVFCATCFSNYFLESSWRISLLSSTQSGMTNEQVLLLMQEWVDMTWHTVWKHLLKQPVWEHVGNTVTHCTKTGLCLTAPYHSAKLNWSQIRQSHHKVAEYH